MGERALAVGLGMGAKNQRRKQGTAESPPRQSATVQN